MNISIELIISYKCRFFHLILLWHAVHVLPKGRFGELISFVFHFKNRHNKTPKPQRFRGFPNRYLFRFAMLVRSTEKDITEFLGKSACDKAFSDFFIFFLGACHS